MDSRIGLDYIVENSDYVEKLGLALDTHNVTVKKQVFELLSALCAYSSDGYKRALQTLEFFKNTKGERYRLNIVVIELDKATVVEYQIALLAFINCVICSARTLQDRIRIRNEFIGLNLLPVLKNLRRLANSEPEIGVQIDVFDEQRECDESQSLQAPNGINLNSHLDVFYAILRQVADTPQEIPFLSILQHLLRIDPKESVSDIIWDTAEKLVHRATLLEDKEASLHLLRSPSFQKFSCPHCRIDITSPNRKQSLSATPGSTSHQAPVFPTPPPPPPSLVPPPPPPPAKLPPPAPIPPAPAPPPPPPMAFGIIPKAPPAPPAPPSLNAIKFNETNRPKSPHLTVELLKPLPQQETPVPRSKMKTINWNKIPPNKVVGKNNIWAIVADSHQDSPMADLCWDEMEGLFCQQQIQGSPKLGRGDSNASNGSDTLERKSRKDNEITLLDGKRSLNVNIFLKQFRSSNEDIIQLVKEGCHYDIGAEKLRGLLKILPELDEREMLKTFDGDNNRLGNAEKFLLQLTQVPDYKLRIESMLLKEEFAANLSYLEPNINAMLYAGDDLMTNKALQEVLYMVVVAGNFLNAGGYAGNAAGFKLSSLQKLTDIRANKPGMNLIHYVALQAERRNKELLDFPSQIGTLENASKTTVEQISNEINTLDNRIKKIKQQIELPKTERDIKEQMADFLLAADRELSMLQRAMKELESVRLQLAEYFCEDASHFKMEECFKIFHNFCEKFRQAAVENEKRKIQEEQALIRRKQREEQLANKKRQYNQPGTPVSDSDNSLLDPSSYEMRYSPMPRRRIGSFNSNGDASLLREDGQSPDITPNGSLRRRRSRALPEEDEGSLMDFLRSSGHDNSTRERKLMSYGSLDRSLARRARSGSGGKKRPDLISVDFGTDRERPSSPSPLVESKPLAVEENKPRISREWRQKIESWLQANEKDEKHNEDYKKKLKRVTNNRRTYETDTESDRGSKLDTLLEEKTNANAITSPSETYKRVYADWKPSVTLEKTDVVSAMEAIEDATPSPKDKSAWRKSNLNVPNSTEESENDARKYRKQKSKEGPTNASSNLQSIIEEDKRKSVIQSLGDRPPSDRLQIYIRKGPVSESEHVKSPNPDENKQTIYIHQPVPEEMTKTSMPAEKHSIYIRSAPNDNSPSTISSIHSSSTSCSGGTSGFPSAAPRRTRRMQVNDEQTNNKIEIDSDNIETPPSIRKNLHSSGTSCRKLHSIDSTDSAQNQEQETLGDGQFDRFSSARRTRRFKRSVDHSSGNETTSPDSISDNTISGIPVPIPIETVKVSSTDIDSSPPHHQSKLDKKDVISRINKVGRNLSRISQEDVREAIRSLKSPSPERSWSPPKEIIREPPTTVKVITHDLNDEGFEETQSLVSDTPSHGKDSTSSCNEEVKVKPKTSAETSPKRLLQKSALQKVLAKTDSGFERSRSLRLAPPSLVNKNLLPRRTNSMRKPESPLNSINLIKQQEVERSNSRTSLRSSRSSLNSAISTNTVKKVPLRQKPSTLTTNSIPSNSSTLSTTLPQSPIRRPLSSQGTKGTSGTPASRSSSSGSSIGPTVRKPPIKSTSASPSSSISTRTKTPPVKLSSGSSISSNTRTTVNRPNSSIENNKNMSTRGPGGFMRPTTATSAKVKGK